MVKSLPAIWETQYDPWVGKMPWRRKWQPTPGLLPGNSHGRRSLVGCSPWGREESDTTEQLHFHFSLSCIGEGHDNPLQCSCLKNPRDGGAWWAAVYGVALSQRRLKLIFACFLCFDIRSRNITAETNINKLLSYILFYGISSSVKVFCRF